MKSDKRSSQVARTTGEEEKNADVLLMILTVLEQKIDSLLIADKYHRHFHIAYIFLILVLILLR